MRTEQSERVRLAEGAQVTRDVYAKRRCVPTPEQQLRAALQPFATHGPHGVWKGTDYADACERAREVLRAWPA